MSKRNRILKKDEILREVDLRIKRSKRIEEACRIICLNKDVDPDRIICPQMPEYIHYPFPVYVLPNPQSTMPAWWLFRDFVEEALKIFENNQC